MTIKALLIGGGNMGEAIVRGALEADVTAPGDWLVVEPNAEKREIFERWGVPTAESASGPLMSLAPEAEIWLAVKPQKFPGVAEALGYPGERTVVSIMAGITTETIRKHLGAGIRPIRVMPNTPVSVRMGVSALAPGAGVTEGHLSFARRVFGAIGEVVDLPEDLIDAFTGVAGSGPGYVFAIAEGLIRGAIECGIGGDDADRIVRALLRGSAELLRTSDRSPEALRQAVTSPGGTTAAGLAVLEVRGLSDALVGAVRAARDRGKALGRED